MRWHKMDVGHRSALGRPLLSIGLFQVSLFFLGEYVCTELSQRMEDAFQQNSFLPFVD